jgi:hypothetical protein
MRWLKTNLILAAYWLFFLTVITSAAQAGQAMIAPEAVPAYQPKYYPFEAGEKAVYRARWNGLFSVATTEIYTTQAVVEGRKVYEVRIEAKTSRAMDLIWKMRDTISSTFDAKALAPWHFKFNQKENSRVIDTEARFNRSTKRWSVNRQQVGKKAKIYEFESNNTLDPITAVYISRSVDFKVGDRLYFNIFGGRYRYLLELLVERKEPIEMETGKIVEAYRIIPRLQNLTKRGYAERFNEATIWISADERRLPIRITSKIVFGSVHIDLVEDQHGAQSTSAASPQPPS